MVLLSRLDRWCAVMLSAACGHGADNDFAGRRERQRHATLAWHITHVRLPLAGRRIQHILRTSIALG